jgi:hypothetical protein
MYRSLGRNWTISRQPAAAILIDDRDGGRQVERDRDCDRRERACDWTVATANAGNGIVTGAAKRLPEFPRQNKQPGLKEFGPFILPEFDRNRVFELRSRLAQSSLQKGKGTGNDDHNIEVVHAQQEKQRHVVDALRPSAGFG